jgi:carbonic anhydrase
MFFQKAVGLLATSAVLASACAPELYKRDGVHPKHVVRSNIPNPITDNRGWSFDTSEEWNSLKEGK